MVAPVEVDEVGVELLIRNELLQEHEVRDRHRLERIKVINRLCHVNQEKHMSDWLFHRWRLDCCHSTRKPINVTKACEESCLSRLTWPKTLRLS